jgi:hypothetical protein
MRPEAAPPSAPLPSPALLPAQAYINNYAGYTKIQRLLFIADKSVGKPLELEALKIAAEELRKVRPMARPRCTPAAGCLLVACPPPRAARGVLASRASSAARWAIGERVAPAWHPAPAV